MQVSSSTATGVRSAQAKGSFYWFDPDNLTLVTDPHHPLYDPRALEPYDEGLVQSMLKFGFMTGSSVEIESSKNQLLVADGRRRVIAAKEVKRRQIAAGAGLTIRVRCIVVKGNAFIGMVLGNTHRKDETVLQLAAKAQYAINNGYSEKETAELFGVTQQTVRNRLAAMALPDTIKRALEMNQITLMLALELGKKSPEEQAKVLAGDAPIRGEHGRQRVTKSATVESDTKKRLSTGQIRKLLDAIKEDKNDGAAYVVNKEFASGLLKFILGDDPTGRGLNAFDPVREIARSVRKD